ncbi:MAG TPA: penicillin acylase family protein [Chloroflexota bacterium]|jgi:penicillin amidase|nr:penicillin acylase family protein [Chloroflexota bacterium]
MSEERIPAGGLHAPVTVRRDAAGVAHVEARDEHDAWFGQGWVSVQDRLWQMESDRRRAAGRWAEVTGQAGVAADVLARRLDLVRASQADVAAMSAPTRAVFDAYAAGVNAALAARAASGGPLPPEFALGGLRPEPWEPWHSVAVFKIRHVFMGTWQQKLYQATLLARVGPQRYAALRGRPPAGSPTILPPGGRVAPLLETALEELEAAAAALGFLALGEGGSNSWAVHGSRTTTGTAVLCNDSHRALDVPNVYWQVHVACPAFDVIGATFAGLPGFPHFGHNGHVAWNITHTAADYQDLYVERFEQDGAVYQTAGGRVPAERRRERIAVAGGPAVEIEAWRTAHGPVVHGDPRSGQALSLRYTATDGPCRAWETLHPMLLARSVEALQESQREWVDPVNNLVAADTAGSIGYLTRGVLPLRTSDAHRQFPAPGWTGEHEWVGQVPFEQLPRAVNPPEGYIATANQAVLEGDGLYIAHEFSAPFRAERIVEVIGGATAPLSPQAIAALQGDVVSRAARAWARRLGASGPYGGDAERARALLAAPGFDGTLSPESGAALLYAHFRRAVAGALYAPLLGQAAWDWLLAAEGTTTHAMITRWLAGAVYALEGETTPDGRPWDDVLRPALETAWRTATAREGADPAGWRWAARHRTAARHLLSATFPAHAARLDPPAVAVGGDGETIQAAGYIYADQPAFPIASLSVYRQVVDLGDVAAGGFVVPGGVSGDPDSAHYADQLEAWRTHRRVPMHYRPEDVRAAAVTVQTLTPG